MSAKEARLYRRLARRLIECEERTKLLKRMVSEEVGFKEEEEFILHEMGKLRGQNKDLRKERKQFLALMMRKKLKDNICIEKELRYRRDLARRNLEDIMGPNSTACRRIVRNSKCEGDKVRRSSYLKNVKKFNYLKNKYGMRGGGLSDLCEDDQKKYEGAKVYSGEEMRPQRMSDPVIVCRQGEDISLNEDELSVLRLGPKFCEFTNLDDVAFEIEVEQMVLKYKWETMDEEKNGKVEDGNEVIGDPSVLARRILFEELFTKEEREDMEDEEEDELNMREASMRMTFDLKNGILDMRKHRVTDIKGNSRVILPRKMRSFDEEARLEMLRQELRGTFNQYTGEKCGSRGLQKSNLTRGEMRGLRSLKKRTKEGELVILPTDKTGLFAVMSRETYLECGLKHTKGDTEVGWEELKTAQSELNGHTAMMIKIFDIGRDWKHTQRVRETMMGEAMSTCPLSLLYKDHKRWERVHQPDLWREVTGG